MGEVYLRDRPSPITACNYSRINEVPTPSFQDRVGDTSACMDLQPGRDIVTKREILTRVTSLSGSICARRIERTESNPVFVADLKNSNIPLLLLCVVPSSY